MYHKKKRMRRIIVLTVLLLAQLHSHVLASRCFVYPANELIIEKDIVMLDRSFSYSVADAKYAEFCFERVSDDNETHLTIRYKTDNTLQESAYIYCDSKGLHDISRCAKLCDRGHVYINKDFSIKLRIIGLREEADGAESALVARRAGKVIEPLYEAISSTHEPLYKGLRERRKKNAPLSDSKLRKMKNSILNSAKKGKEIPKVLDDALAQDREFMLKLIKLKENTIALAVPKLQKDRELMTEAINRDCHALVHASKSIRSEKKLMLPFIKRCSDTFGLLDEGLKKDSDILRIAVKTNPYAVLYAFEHGDPNLKKDRAFVLQAVKTFPPIFRYVNKALRDDKEIIDIMLKAGSENEK
jgi:hypothetical protein